MDNVISIRAEQINGQYIDTVDARDLYEFLEVSARFNDWVLRRIAKYGFVENQDFTTFTQKRVKGRPSLEYHLSLDMAKELSMVERTEKGKQARQYFIDCERRARNLAPATPQNPILAGLSTLALELDKTQTQVADLDSRIAKLETDTNVVAFPALSERVSRRPGPKLKRQWLDHCRRQRITGRQFCEAHGYARSTVTEALVGKTNGPVSRAIRREIIAILVGDSRRAT